MLQSHLNLGSHSTGMPGAKVDKVIGLEVVEVDGRGDSIKLCNRAVKARPAIGHQY